MPKPAVRLARCTGTPERSTPTPVYTPPLTRDILEAGEEWVMAKDWHCLIGLHDWREVELPDRDKCAECTRCGKRDYRRLLQRTSGKWRGGDPPAGEGLFGKH